jgi:O-methyltransferase
VRKPPPLVVAALKRAFPTLVYRTPQSSLRPERLYAYLDALWQRRELEGAVVEIGCFVGGTAALASTMLRNVGHPKRYVCIDTFSGFVGDHFDADLRRGLPPAWRRDFSANSRQMVRRLLDHYGCHEVELLEADVSSLDPDRIPGPVAVCLLDVDLEIPTYEGLRRVVPRLADGGVVLVDDCEEGEVWPGPAVAYRRFVSETNRPEQYAFGMGIVSA